MGKDADEDSPATARDTLAPGAIIHRKYRVERALAAGGMGRLVVAEQIDLARKVVIKVLQPELAHDEMMRQRFIREAELLAKLDSEHVVRVHDVGALDDDTPYLVMELLEGEDLEGRCDRGAVAIEDAVRFAREACLGLAEAHARGVVHRDVKPQNLFVAKTSKGEVVKVIDFGIAKRSWASTASLKGATTGELMVGSPAFMAPEQIMSSRDVDARADIWSLGATLYQLLAGSPPFRADNEAQLLRKILSKEAAPVAIARPEVSDELAAIVHSCLAKDPSARPQTMTELAERLERVPLATATKARAREAHAEGRHVSRGRAPRRSRSAAILVAACMTTLLLGAGLLLLNASWLRRASSAPTSSSSSTVLAPSTSTTSSSSSSSPLVEAAPSPPVTGVPPASRQGPAHSKPVGDAGPARPVQLVLTAPERRALEDEEIAALKGMLPEIDACARSAPKLVSGDALTLRLRWAGTTAPPTFNLDWETTYDPTLEGCVLAVAHRLSLRTREVQTVIRVYLRF